MEALIIAATAIATSIMAKFWEKTGEQLSEEVFEQSEKVFASFKKRAPKVASALEVELPDSIEYKQAVLEVKAIAEIDQEFSEGLQALAQAVQRSQNLTLQKLTEEIVQSIQNQSLGIQNSSKLAEKVGIVIQGGSVSVQNLNVD